MTFRRYASIGQDRGSRTKTANGDLVVELAFASELPYERWWGVEILDMSESSVRLGRLNDGAALLFNHNWSDLRGTQREPPQKDAAHDSRSSPDHRLGVMPTGLSVAGSKAIPASVSNRQ